jgi:hypothetical protein
MMLSGVPVRHMLVGGGGAIAIVAIASAMSPAVDDVLTTVFLSVCDALLLTVFVLVVRWAYGEWSWRRALSPPVPASAATSAGADARGGALASAAPRLSDLAGNTS